MAMEPKDFQYSWFLKLAETSAETAHKYREILCQLSMAMEPLISKNAIVNTPPVTNFTPQTDLFDTLLSGNTPIISDLLGPKDLSDSVQFPNLPSSTRNGDRPIMPAAEQVPQRIPEPQHQQQQSQQSIPLYRRQAGCSGQQSQASFDNARSSAMSQSTSDGDGSANLFDNLFNHNGVNNTALSDTHHQFHQGLQLQNLANLQAQNLYSNVAYAGGMGSSHQHHSQQHHPQSQHEPSSSATYASVLANNNQQQQQAAAQHQTLINKQQMARQQQHLPNNSDEKDPFAAIRELGQRGNGFYHYFK